MCVCVCVAYASCMCPSKHNNNQQGCTPQKQKFHFIDERCT